jgi:hypothetical protein
MTTGSQLPEIRTPSFIQEVRVKTKLAEILRGCCLGAPLQGVRGIMFKQMGRALLTVAATMFVVLGLIALSAGAFAQGPTSLIDKALMAAPRNLKDGATVIRWKPDFTYETLRNGTNRLMCYDRSGQPGQQPFAVECTSIANLDRVAQNLKLEAIPDKKASLAAFDAAEKDGTRRKQEFGSVWYHINGVDAEHTRSHVTIAVQGATGQSFGLPEDSKQGAVWIMNAGTSTAHLMIPGE